MSDDDGTRPADGVVEPATLYVVATPIGNLEDITLRALKVLRSVSVIAAEDTRNTALLLDRHGIRTRMISLHEHNESRRADAIVEQLAAGQSVALVSDAGTPLLSDPGAILVAKVRDAGFRVIPIPGASALVAALSAAGLAGTSFQFVGFLPDRSAARRKAIASYAQLACILIFYEAPHRVVACVRDLATELGGQREIVIARELTKLFESIHRCRLDEAAAWLEADADRQRGEFVLLVSGPAHRAPDADAIAANADKVLRALMAELPLAQSVKLACAITGMRRGDLYARALQLAANNNSVKVRAD